MCLDGFMLRFLLLIPSLFLSTLVSDTLELTAGWFFYQEDLKESAQRTKVDLSTVFEFPQPLSLETASEHLTVVQQLINSHKSLALLEPTPKNIEDYIKIQHLYLEKAQAFSVAMEQGYLEVGGLTDLPR